MNILYASLYNAKDIHNWSGTGYYIAKTLEDQHFNVEYTGALDTKFSIRTKLNLNLCKLLNKKYYYFLDPDVAKNYAIQVMNKINKNTDIIFAPGSTPIALLETNKPKVYYTDATFAGLLNFYKEFSDLSWITVKNGHFLEQIALESSKLILFSSDWAAKSAIENYKVDPSKVKVVPFGANLNCNRTKSDIEVLINSKSKKKLSLLFIGVDWVRKGGDLALNITNKLNEIGIETSLHIVGIDQLPEKIKNNYVINHGFISKSTAEGKKKIEKLLSESHFLILPSKAECFGIVFCEANSFGLPCIAHNVGGIPTIIREYVNGKTFNLNSDTSEWVNFISDYFLDYNKYKTLCLSSFNEYENRLSWDSTGKAINKLLKEL